LGYFRAEKQIRPFIADTEESLALLRSKNAIATVFEIVRHYRADERSEREFSAAVRRLKRSARGAPS
jgi:hypothetical protein